MNSTVSLNILLFFQRLAANGLRLSSGFIIAILGFGALLCTANADTFVNRVGDSVQDVTLNNTTWTLANSPYVLERHVTISAGSNLTIESGVTVKVSTGYGIFVSGSIQANNDTFTSNGDTTWLGLYLGPTSTNSLLDGCTIEKAGRNNMGYIHGAYRTAAIYMDNATATVRNCIIQDSAGQGIEAWLGQPTLQNNSFKNMAASGYPVVLDDINTVPVISGNSFSGTGIGGVYMPGGTIGGTNRWNKPGTDFPYYLDGGVTLPKDALLVVDAGVTLKTGNGSFSIAGTLLVQGTSAEPVVFTGRAAEPTPGQWYGLYFSPDAGSSVIDHLTVSCAGRNNLGYIHSTYRLTSIYLDGCSPAFNDLQVLNSGQDGIDMWECSSIFNNLTISGSGGFAIQAQSNSRPIINTGKFQDNGNNDSGYHLVGMDATCVPNPTGITCVSNRFQAVRIWGGTMATNTLWKKWNSETPYYVTDQITVPTGVTLTVEQGATVKLQNCGIYVSGVLKAEGNPSQINFTSYRDDSSAGDSNGDGDASAPDRGDWRGFYLAGDAGSSVLDRCSFAYAGQNNLGYFHGGYRMPTIYVDTCSPIIQNSSFAHYLHGIELWSSSAVIQNNTFADTKNDGFPIVCDTIDCLLKISGNSTDASGNPGVYMQGGTVTQSGTWQKPGTNFPYLVYGNVGVAGGVVLTLAPGCTFKNLNSGWYIDGALLANGTATEPVTFTSRAAEPAPSQWKGIYFGATAGNSIANHTTVEYAGQNNLNYLHSDYRLTSIYIDGSNPTFQNLTVRQSGGIGVEMWNARPSFNDLVVDACGSHAMKAYASSRPQIVNAIFSGNTGAYTISCDADSVPNPANTTFITNSNSGIQVYGGEVIDSTLWRNFGTNAPYVITADISIRKGTELTVQTGANVKALNSGLYVYGNLHATNVTFTSANDDAVAGDSNGDTTNTVAAPAQWKGIYLSADSSASTLEKCRLAWSGLNNLGYFHSDYRKCAVYVDGSSPRITDCIFSDMGGQGLELFGSEALVRSNQFLNVPSGWFAMVNNDLSRFPKVSGNSATGPGYLGFHIPGGGLSSAVTWTKAGTNFPYFVWNNLSIDAPSSLSIEPGTLIKPRTGGIYVSSTLSVNGSPSDRVVFGNMGDVPVPETWTGIYFAPSATNSSMSFCDLYGAGRNNLLYANSEYQTCAIYINGGNAQLRNLKVYANGGYGIRAFGSAALVCDSLIYSNAWGNVRLDAASPARILNNTLASAGDMGVYATDNAPLIANNIIAFNNGVGLYVPSGTPAEHHNIVFGNAKGPFGGTAILNLAASDLQVDPQFVEIAAANYHLNSGSPAINAGDNSLVAATWTDLDGRLRIHATTVDLGAYESGAAQATRLVDGMIRKAGDASYIGDNVFDPASQTVSQTVLFDTPAIYNLKFKYNGNVPDGLLLRVIPPAQGWTVRAYDSLTGGNEITDKVFNQGNFVVSTNATSTTELRFEVTPSKSTAGNAIQTLEFNLFASGDPLVKDSLVAVTINKPFYQPDLAVRRTEDVRFTGEDLVNNNGAGQQKMLEVEPEEKATFILKAINLGNLPDSFVLRGPSGGAGWDVRYYDAIYSTNDITAAVTGAGWTNTPVAAGNAFEFKVEVTGSANIPAGTIKDLLVTATSSNDGTKLDATISTVKITAKATTSQSGTYTLDADFEKGVLVGVEYQSTHNQLQLSAESVTLPFIWVPNANEGTVSKVDTRTGRELGRYRTGPPGLTLNPSRTTVDVQGNCWVANRQSATVVKIGLYENGQYSDRNGNGVIETSQDKNGDGTISSDEMLDWGKDECVLLELVLIPGQEGTYIPGTYTNAYANDYWNPGPRGVAVDGQGNVWLGTYGSKKFYYADGVTGQILKTNDVSSVNHTSYGALIDGNGILWSAGNDKNHVLRLDPKDDSFRVIETGHLVYGLGLDRSNHLFATGWESSKLSRINTLTGMKEWTKDALYQMRGVAVTDDGDVWVANSGPGYISRWSNDGLLKATIPVGNQPTGVAVDADGKVWAVNVGDENIERINPANNSVDLSKRIVGGNHYGYSDMTGIISRTATIRSGRWSVIHNGGLEDTPWGTISWHSAETTGTSIKVRARSSNDRINWTLWESAVNGFPLHSTAPGKYLEVEAAFQAGASEVSPILYDLTVTPSGQAPVGDLVYGSDFQSATASDVWSQTNITTAPSGQAKFLGRFGSTNVVLTLPDLTPHSSVMVSFDLLIIGSWDGNNTNDGPDILNVDVAGGLKLLNASFNNGPTNSAALGQSYPESMSGPMHPALTGAAETNVLGFVSVDGAAADSTYKYSQTFTHSADTLTLNFSASGLDTNLNLESWGLDNVQVRVIPLSAPPYLKPMGKPANGKFHVMVKAELGKNLEFQLSTNLTTWTTIVATNTLTTNLVECVDENAPPSGRRFYRAIQKP